MDTIKNRTVIGMNHLPAITKTFENEGFNNLQLHTSSGNIELVGHDETSVKVEVYFSVRSWLSLFLVREPVDLLDSDTYQLTMGVSGNQLTIWSKPNYFHPFFWFYFPQISFKIFLPKNLKTVSKTWNGHIALKNLIGNHTFTTWGGRLLMENSQGNLQAKTMGGNIRILDCEAQINAETMGGNIVLTQNNGYIKVDTKGGNILILKHKGQIHFSTWGGNIEAADVVGELECSTKGGNIKLRNMSGNVGASTLGGNITAEMPYIKEYAWFDTSGGNITTYLPMDTPMDFEVKGTRVYHAGFQNFEGIITKNRINGKLNGGGKHINIKTGGGKVRIEEVLRKIPEPVFEASQNVVAEKEVAKPINERPKQPQNFQKSPVLPDKQPFLFDINSVLFTLVFCLLLGYGLSGIVYFSLEFFNSESTLAPVNRGVFYSNIASSLGAFCAIYIFLHFLEGIIKTNWAKYVALIVLTSGWVVIFQILVGIFYWSKIDRSTLQSAGNNFSIFYNFLPPIVSCIYLFYWQSTRKLTRKISEQEYQLLNLEKLKSKAQLDALEARINPHFLYNSLNSIAGLIHENPEKAEDMTIQLSKLFRYTTGRTDENFHNIADELEIIKSYLAIEQVRFGSRLHYKILCEDEALTQKIPRFLLQPLVENAIKHGISKITHDGKIEIKITKISDHLSIKIHDNGPAFDELLGGGFGLRSIKEKLKIVYGEKATFDIENQPEKAVMITLPINQNEI